MQASSRFGSSFKTPHLLLLQHRGELLPRHSEAGLVSRVDDKDYGVRVGVVAAPVRPDGRLPTQVPHLCCFVVCY